MTGAGSRSAAGARAAGAAPTPPRAEARPTRLSAHGLSWADDYAWIRADNWREVLRDPSRLPADIRALLEAENAYADAVLAPTAALAETASCAKCARGSRRTTASRRRSTAPAPIIRAFVHGGQHRIYCRQPRGGGKETVLIDGDARAEGKAFFHLAARAPFARPCQTRLERRRHGLRDPDAIARARPRPASRTLPTASSSTTGDIVWTARFAGVPLCRAGREPPPVPGDAASARDARRATMSKSSRRPIRPGSSASRRPASAARRSSRCMATMLRRRWSSILTHPAAAPRLVAPRRPGLPLRGRWITATVFSSAPTPARADFKIVVAPRDAPQEANWRTFVAAARRAVHRRRDAVQGLPRAARARGRAGRASPSIDLADGDAHEIAFEEETYFLALRAGLRIRHSDSFRFSYSSMAAGRGDLRLRFRRRGSASCASGRRCRAASTLRRMSRAASSRRADDGESVPVSLIHQRDLKLDGSAPLLLYGYGAYGYRDRRELLDQPPVAGRSRLRLRHRPCARRHGQGLALVRGRQARQEAEHLQRFHRRRAPSSSPRAMRSRARSSPRAAAPAAC